MTVDALLATIILVGFLVTIIMAIGSYVAYKLRETRRPRAEQTIADGGSPWFVRIPPEELERDRGGTEPP
ncbi:MAG: hypothetical protein ACRELD_11010 [Longimicrobiales bacterium]